MQRHNVEQPPSDEQDEYSSQDPSGEDDHEGGGGGEGTDEANFGFHGMEQPVEKERQQKRQREETEEEKGLKAKINLLLCRYPALVPRTSSAIMKKLDELSASELKNVYTNALNDIAEVRGTPSAETIILALTYHADSSYLVGYTDTCLKDVELKRDIETEVIELIGFLNNKVNILFRFINNAYSTYKRNRTIYRDESPVSQLFTREPDASNFSGQLPVTNAPPCVQEIRPSQAGTNEQSSSPSGNRQ